MGNKKYTSAEVTRKIGFECFAVSKKVNVVKLYEKSRMNAGVKYGGIQNNSQFLFQRV